MGQSCRIKGQYDPVKEPNVKVVCPETRTQDHTRITKQFCLLPSSSLAISITEKKQNKPALVGVNFIAL